MNTFNLKDKFQLFNDYWTPRIVGELNGQYVKIAKVKGDFVWHDHANEDELFYIVKGELKIDFRDKSITLHEGDMTIVPKGVAHKPSAKEETWIMMMEPISTQHTGEVIDERTVENPDWI